MCVLLVMSCCKICMPYIAKSRQLGSNGGSSNKQLHSFVVHSPTKLHPCSNMIDDSWTVVPHKPFRKQPALRQHIYLDKYFLDYFIFLRPCLWHCPTQLRSGLAYTKNEWQIKSRSLEEICYGFLGIAVADL